MLCRRLLPIIGALAVVVVALATPASARVAARAACGPSWSVVPSPSPGSVNNSLADVVLTSAGNGWAVGTELTESGPALLTLPLALHFDGSTWSEVATAGHLKAQLAGVTAFGPRNVWAVGWVVQGTTESVPLVEYFDGTAWKVVNSPQIQEANLLSVAGSGTRDIWAVGLVRGFAPQMLAEHFNGTSWRVVRMPSIPSVYVDLESVVDIGPANVWAVGYYLADSGNYAPLSVHWDGAHWKAVPVPDLGAAGSQLYDVTVAGDGSVVAVGQATDTSGSASPVALRWSGTEWLALDSPLGANSLLDGLTAAGPKALMAVGWSTNASGDQSSLTESFRNGGWSIVPSPDAGGGSRLSDVAQTPGTSALVAVGTTNPFGVGQTLIEVICV